MYLPIYESKKQLHSFTLAPKTYTPCYNRPVFFAIVSSLWVFQVSERQCRPPSNQDDETTTTREITLSLSLSLSLSRRHNFDQPTIFEKVIDYRAADRWTQNSPHIKVVLRMRTKQQNKKRKDRSNQLEKRPLENTARLASIRRTVTRTNDSKRAT